MSTHEKYEIHAASEMGMDSTGWTTVIRHRKDKTWDRTQNTIWIPKHDRKARNSLRGHGTLGAKPKGVRHKRSSVPKGVRNIYGNVHD